VGFLCLTLGLSIVSCTLGWVLVGKDSTLKIVVFFATNFGASSCTSSLGFSFGNVISFETWQGDRHGFTLSMSEYVVGIWNPPLSLCVIWPTNYDGPNWGAKKDLWTKPSFSSLLLVSLSKSQLFWFSNKSSTIAFFGAFAELPFGTLGLFFFG